jgi:hypothetical protein
MKLIPQASGQEVLSILVSVVADGNGQPIPTIRASRRHRRESGPETVVLVVLPHPEFPLDMRLTLRAAGQTALDRVNGVGLHIVPENSEDIRPVK